jgi:hypothetical protein
VKFEVPKVKNKYSNWPKFLGFLGGVFELLKLALLH